MADWASVLGGVVSGATSGPIGLVFGGAMAYFKKRQSDKHEIAKIKENREERAEDRSHDLALSDKEIEGAQALGKMRMDETMYATDSAALSGASESQDKEISGLAKILDKCWPWVISLFIAPMFAIVTFTQKMIRPVLTMLLLYMTWELQQQMAEIIDWADNASTKDVMEIQKMITISILNASNMALGFWFVARFDKLKLK